MVPLHRFYYRKIASKMLNVQDSLPLQEPLVANLSDIHPLISRKYPAEQGMDV